MALLHFNNTWKACANLEEHSRVLCQPSLPLGDLGQPLEAILGLAPSLGPLLDLVRAFWSLVWTFLSLGLCPRTCNRLVTALYVFLVHYWWYWLSYCVSNVNECCYIFLLFFKLHCAWGWMRIEYFWSYISLLYYRSDLCPSFGHIHILWAPYISFGYCCYISVWAHDLDDLWACLVMPYFVD